MEDKPMAWMDKYNAVIPASHKYFQPELLKDYDIPLYTQECWENKFKQQQAEIEALKKEAALQRLSDFTQEVEKTLTDEEITQCLGSFPKYNNEWYEEHFLMFARAILKKAQEK